jgi:hypothetical protein
MPPRTECPEAQASSHAPARYMTAFPRHKPTWYTQFLQSSSRKGRPRDAVGTTSPLTTELVQHRYRRTRSNTHKMHGSLVFAPTTCMAPQRRFEPVRAFSLKDSGECQSKSFGSCLFLRQHPLDNAASQLVFGSQVPPASTAVLSRTNDGIDADMLEAAASVPCPVAEENF